MTKSLFKALGDNNKIWDVTDIRMLKEYIEQNSGANSDTSDHSESCDVEHCPTCFAENNDWAKPDKRPNQYRKLIKFIETGIKVQFHTTGLMLLEDRFVVSLNKNRWKILGKNKWYHHSYDINNFVNKYIKNKGDVK